ncbi:MAG: hypothetical protein U9R44_07740 [Candidatus Omnitrophota bacterium]|nr:hypothetical protein [Candidatus Omnitrophota bacterium]
MRKRISKFLYNLTIKEEKNFGEKLLFFILSVYRELRDILRRSDNVAASRIYCRIIDLQRKIKGGKYNFISINELLIWSTEFIKSLPISYDVIVGIPRSGLLVGNTIALKLGKPFTVPELFCKDIYWKSKGIGKVKEYKKILLVDDSINSGETMRQSLDCLYSYRKDLVITKAALIATEESKDLVDLYYEIIPQPRIFEWNLLHAKKAKLALDMDGVICENCPPGVDVNNELYLEWIRNAKPYLIPNFEIDVIVSNRLEKYRADTEKWLFEHGVRWKELVLWNIRSKEERKGRYAQRKIKILLEIKPEMFWESSFGEAEQIWAITKIPTLCVDKMIMFS